MAGSYELPKASEKLSFKFILDALKEETLSAPALEEIAPPPPAKESSPPAREASCGTEAPATESPEDEAHESIPMDELKLPAGKKYFRIKEVAKLIGVEPYVLRYWESEFSVVKPAKSGSGHRVYSRKDVEALHLIRHLLHVERYSIKGAKKKLLERRRQAKAAARQTESTPHQAKALRDLAAGLRELIHLTQGNPGIL